MQQRQREEEVLALEDVPNGGGDTTPRGRQTSAPTTTVVGLELVAGVGGAAEETQQFMTPARGIEDTERVSSEMAGQPQSAPRALAPTPLFSEKQLSLMDEMYHRTSSPLLPQGMPSLVQRSLPEMPRQRMVEEERVTMMAQEMLNPMAKDVFKPEVFNISSRPTSEGHQPSATAAEDHMWRLQVGRELRDMGERLTRATDENQALKEEIALLRLEGRFYTPESEKGKVKMGIKEQAAGTSSASGGEGAGRQTTAEPSQMELLMLMMQNMQEIQKHMLNRDDHGASNGVEVVRSGAMDLPKLAEWDSQERPLKMGDWMALLEPAVSDLSNSSELWWTEMVREVQLWYQQHLQMAPLDRAAHDMVAPQALQMKKWQRLERRMASMLLAAVPDQQREELVAAKRLSVFSILCHLQLTYQPGGLGEKQTLLHNIESPPEATSLGDAVLGLRRWMRWRQRAEELKATEPDPSVLVRAVTKLTAKVLEAHRELSFRIALARSALMVDTRPTKEVVGQYATHLLAEIETVAHLEKKQQKVKTEAAVKIKKFDEDTKGSGKGFKGRDAPKVDEKMVCKYFTQESGNGCRKGKSCKWAHVMDDKRRCYTCGSTKHMASKCPTTSSAEDQSPPKVMKAEKEEIIKSDFGETESVAGSTTSASKGESSEKVKSLIDEANQMLKTMQQRNEQESQRATVEDLQRQLNELRSRPGGALRAFKLTRMSIQEESEMALLDSRATHPLRCLEVGDDPSSMAQVWVSLADGKKIEMLMTKGGVMVALDSAIEPIIPLGWLARSGCTVEWTAEGLEVVHPERGVLPVIVKNGCPQVPKQLALELIKDYEISEIERALKKLEQQIGDRQSSEAEVEWLHGLVRHHPALRDLPEKIKDQLVLAPGEWKDLPFNRFKRRKLREGCVLHLYAGEDEGYTLQRALKARGYGKRIMEIDILRSAEHNMLGASKTYQGLLRAAMDGSLLAVVGGPNCRTRSVLRHYAPGPRPLRHWGGGEFGAEDLSVEEQAAVDQDDTLLWRMVFLAVVGDFARRSVDEKAEMIFAIEQPEEPHYKPEVVSFWWTREWQVLRDCMGWKETAFNQGNLVYKPEVTPIKPTKFGGNLELRLPDLRNHLAVPRPPGGSGDSKSLARWVPKLMDLVADALCRQAFRLGEDVKIKAMSWEDHCAAGHVPFRRDCRVCQEASAKGRPHRKVVHPLSGTLSVDVAGPLVKARELHWAEGGPYMRYMLVAAFTWLKPRGGESDPADVGDEGGDGLPQIHDGEPEEDHGEPDGDHGEPDGEHGEPEGELHGEEELRPREGQEEPAEDRVEPEINVFRFCIPLEKKKAPAVLQAINELYIQLRVHGYNVVRLHSDRGGEFRGKAMDQWCRTRDILRTKTPGMSPQSNGRVERSVQEVKARVQRALRGADLGPEHWPAACRFVHSLERKRLAMRNERQTPPFGKEILIKRRYWGRGDLENTHETARYMYQDFEGHGHCVLKPDGMYAVAPYYITKVSMPVDDSTWLAVLEEIDKDREAIAVRRRLRGRPR